MTLRDKIISILAPELEKARKWDRVKEIVSQKDCKGCPSYVCATDGCDACDECCPFDKVVEALEAEGEKDA